MQSTELCRFLKPSFMYVCVQLCFIVLFPSKLEWERIMLKTKEKDFWIEEERRTDRFVSRD